MESITLYNQQGEKVGETYPRRAKQLVRSGRAAWIEESVALQLTADIPPPTTIKEEINMVDEDTYATNGSPKDVTQPSDCTEDNDLLMYLARKNVRKKRNLLKHIAAFAVASLVLLIFYGSYADGSHWMASSAYLQMNNMNKIMDSTGFEAYQSELTEMSWFLSSITSLVDPIWVFLWGIMAAWGGWILTQIAIWAVRKIQNRSIKKPKPDPVALEYVRLKSMASDGIVADKY